MKKSIVRISLLSLLLLFSCAQDDNDDSSAQTSPPPQEEQAPAPQEPDDGNDDDEDVPRPNPTVRYSKVELSADSFFGIFSHHVTMDLNRRPVIITGNYQSYPELPEDDARDCTFQIQATEYQADKIERLADKLRTCVYEIEDDIVVDGDSNLITLTKTDGSTVTAKKLLEGENDEVYLCKGRKAFYSYIKTIVKKEVDRPECPENAMSSMFD